MNSWWLRCFCWQNHIYFISLRTGKVIYRHEVGKESIKLKKIGKTNSIIVDKWTTLMQFVIFVVM